MADFELENAPIAYGTANTASQKNKADDIYYQLARIQNRILLDFGTVAKNGRVGMNLEANGIKTPCLLKSLHAPAQNSTDDGIVWEIHNSIGQGVKERYSLQYVDKKEMPLSFPELILFPENVVYVIPGQESRVMVVLEPINLLNHATILV